MRQYSFPLCVLGAVLVTVNADAPLGGGYSYNKPSTSFSNGGYSGGGGFSGGSFSSGGYPSGGGGGYSSGGGYSGGGGYSSGGGYPSGGGGYSNGGGSYVSVAPGPSTYEGQYVDPKLLEQVRQVILKEEANSGSAGGYPSSSYGAPAPPSSSYGAPSSSYGPPSTSYGAPSSGGWTSKVTGIDLEGVKPAIQVAQYEQSASQGGYPSGGHSSGGISSSYGAPSLGGSSFGGGFSSLGGSYGAPAPRPSSTYGAPF